MPTAAIIGSGIAGSVSAMALQLAGYDPAIYEGRDDASRGEGAFLTVAPNGLDTLRAIDALSPVLNRGFASTDNVLLSGAGRQLGVISMSRPLDQLPSVTISRADLYEGLLDEATSRGIRVEYGKRLVDMQSASGDGHRGAAARFADGTTANVDLIVGCDGVHSRVRSAIDPIAPEARYLGLRNFGGCATQVSADLASEIKEDTWTMVFGKRAFFGYARDPYGNVLWFANVPEPIELSNTAIARTSDDEWKRQLTALFSTDAGPACALIAATTEPLYVGNTYDLKHVPTWHSGAAIILGDAAHATSPSSGQGASMAIEDGVVLGKCLRDLPTIGEAFAAFEQLRRGRVEQIVAHGARLSSSKMPGRVGRFVRDLILPYFLRRAAKPEAQSWLYDFHVEWDRRVGLEAVAV